MRLIDLAADMVYNGIAYGVKRSAQKDLLIGKILAGFMHQGAGTSWCRRCGSTISWMNGICRLPVYSLLSHVCYSVLQKFLHYIPVSTLRCFLGGHWKAWGYQPWRDVRFCRILHPNMDFRRCSESPPAKLILGHLNFVLPFMDSVPSLRMEYPSRHTGTPSSLMVKSSLWTGDRPRLAFRSMKGTMPWSWQYS